MEAVTPPPPTAEGGRLWLPAPRGGWPGWLPRPGFSCGSADPRDSERATLVGGALSLALGEGPLPSLAPAPRCIPYLRWLRGWGRHNVNKAKMGTEVSDTRG